MEFLLIIKPEAEKDIQNSIKYYAEQNLKLPVEFLKKLDESLLAIQQNPQHYQKRYLEIRIVFTKKFPYAIFFTLEENKIFVHAVLHNKQNPTSAKKRVK